MSKSQIPILTIDVVYFTIINCELYVLVVKRDKDPFKGKWALPGGYVHCDEDDSMLETALRVIKSKSKVKPNYIEQVETVAGNQRDPRGWSATVLFVALVNEDRVKDSTDIAMWMRLPDLNGIGLAFDHELLIQKAHERVVSKSRYTSMPLYFVPDKFTLTEAQGSFEITTNLTLEKKSFRRRLQDANIIEETSELSTTGKRRAALFRLRKNQQLHFFPRMLG